ncbi:MAG: hypothetical protein LBK67_04390 [Coriobacteriales bacterium]|jgi:hypothetical protein|nr:hypothetical protein [Coriobacteriales bacterium]
MEKINRARTDSIREKKQRTRHKMTWTDAREIVLAEVSFNGTPALFSELRLEHATVPEFLHVYEIRHAKGDPFRPTEVAHTAPERFYGTLVTTRKLPFSKADSVILPDHFAFDFKRASVMTLSEFIAARHLKKMEARKRSVLAR